MNFKSLVPSHNPHGPMDAPAASGGAWSQLEGGQLSI